MIPTDVILKAYAKAWCEPDDEARRDLLKFCWSENGIYQDPSVSAKGRDALIEHIGNLHSEQPGCRVEITSGFSQHHGKIQFNWRFVNPEGEVMINGVDFGVLDRDGRLNQIVGFFGPPPELPD